MQDNIADIIRHYVDGLPARLASIVSSWERLKHINWDPIRLDAMIQTTHKLAGSGETFQFPEISRAAAELEKALNALREADGSMSEKKKIAPLIDVLSLAIKKALSDSRGVPADAPVVEDIVVTPAQIAVVDDDEDMAALVANWLGQLGHTPSVFPSPEAMLSQISERQFDIILLDIHYPGETSDGLLWAERLREQLMPDARVVIMSGRTDLSARLRALRAGATAYLSKPLDIAMVKSCIEEALRQKAPENLRILCVDDDESALAHYRHTLGACGFIVETLRDPRKLLFRLEHFSPHALLLDHRMPELSGIEVGHMLRQDPRFLTIPIIYISADADHLKRDDRVNLITCTILPKGTRPLELARLLRARISQSRAISSRIHQVSRRDHNTGLGNQAWLLSEVDSLLEGTSASRRSHALVQLSIDSPAYFLKSQGRRTMMQLSEHIATFLGDHLLQRGHGCPMGNASFLLLINGDSSDSVKNSVSVLHEALREHRWQAGPSAITFSMGAVMLSQVAQTDQALLCVEEACTDAMAQGGDRIGWTQRPGQTSAQSTEETRALIQEGHFTIAYQPIVSVETGDTLFESSLRLHGRDGRIFSAPHFTSLLDSSYRGGCHGIDKWMIEQVINELASLTGRDSQNHSVVVRMFSPIRECFRALPAISNAISATRIRGSRRVIFAFSEGMLMRDLESGRRFIQEIRLLDCGAMVSDCGTSGYSAKLLHSLGKVDYVKMSVEFGHSSIDSKVRRQEIQDIRIAASENAVLIAAGVEDVTVMTDFWTSGIRYFQGYFIQRPGAAMRHIPESLHAGVGT